MTEKLNNQEQVSDIGGNGGSDYPPFDPDAAEAARQQRMAEYKAEHPEAVDDINKARAMAEAEIPYRENMQDIRGYIAEKENPSHEDSPESLAQWKRRTNAENLIHTAPLIVGLSGEEEALHHQKDLADQAAQRVAAEYDAHEQEMEHIRQNADATRIEDVNKAQYMAEAEDREREKEINVQNAIRQRRDPGYQFRNISDEQKRAEFEASATRGRTDIRYQEEFLKNTNQPHDFESAAKSTLEMHKRAAEQAGEEAGEHYDRSH